MKIIDKMRITNQIQDYNINKIHYNPNFGANRIAVAEPVIDGVSRKIEIFSIGKKDYAFLKKIFSGIDLKKMLPSFANKPNFDVWNKLGIAIFKIIFVFSREPIISVADVSQFYFLF